MVLTRSIHTDYIEKKKERKKKKKSKSKSKYITKQNKSKIPYS